MKTALRCELTWDFTRLIPASRGDSKDKQIWWGAALAVVVRKLLLRDILLSLNIEFLLIVKYVISSNLLCRIISTWLTSSSYKYPLHHYTWQWPGHKDIYRNNCNCVLWIPVGLERDEYKCLSAHSVTVLQYILY